MVRMTFAEHLEDLRLHLLRALLGLIPGVLLGLLVGGPVVRYMREPARQALYDYHMRQLHEREKEFLEASRSGAPIEVVELQWYVPRDELTKLVQAAVNEALRQRGIAGGGAGSGPKTPGEPATQALPSVADVEDRNTEASQVRGAPSTGQLPSMAPSTGGSETVGLRAPVAERDLADFSSEATSPSGSLGENGQPSLAWYQRLYRRILTWVGLSWDEPDQKLVAAEAAAGLPTLLPQSTVLARELAEGHYVAVRMVTPRVPLEVATSAADLDAAVVSLGPYETFMAFLKASIVAGVVISSPWVFYQLWSFVAAGLYSYERRVVYRYLPLSTGLFVGGALFCFIVVLPVIMKYLLTFNSWLGVQPQIRLSEWMGFATLLPLMFGIAFQLPIVMLALERVGIFTVETYRTKRRYAILLIAFLSMMLTPPDPGSMISMMLPTIALYELGIILCGGLRLSGARRALPSES
jgi:Tat protein translocase TatC